MSTSAPTKPVVLVPGTWAWQGKPAEGSWWWPSSVFVRHLATRGYRLPSVTRPFVWSTDLAGLGSHSDWRAGGESLYAYIVPPLCEDRQIPARETRVVAHSHGGNVVFYACASGLKVQTLVTVATPIRRDMRHVIAAARPHIGYWLHLYTPCDWLQWGGALLDGRVGFYQQMTQADANLQVADAGHSSMLTDPAYTAYWDRIVDVMDREPL